MPDEGFTEQVQGRIHGWHQLRRWSSGLCAAFFIGVALYLGLLAPLEVSQQAPLGMEQALAALLFGLGLCGALWIDTEPLGPPI